MRLTKRFQNLQGALLLHELSYFLLIIVTAAIGISWAFAWQHSSTESLRLTAMTSEVQNIRGELYRQLKEVFDASFLEDADAPSEYDHYTQGIRQRLQQLSQLADTNEELAAVQAISSAYNRFHDETVKLFSPASYSQQQKQLMDLRLEQFTFNKLEAVFTQMEKVLQQQQLALSNKQQRWMEQLLWLVSLPVLLAVSLLLFARRYMRAKVLSPLNSVIQGTKRISTGELEQTILPSGADELKKLADTINTMAIELKQSRDKLVETQKQAALGELVPLVAHNIRNPLAGIRAAAQVTLGDDISSATREALTDIIVAVDRLERWVTSLLSYLHPLRPHFVETSLMDVASDAASLIALQLSDKQLKLNKTGFELADPITTQIDSNLLEQAICNLIQNAIEASAKDGVIELEYQQTANTASLLIKDLGQGMRYQPNAQQPQADSDSKRLSCGLGIPFSEKVLKLHQGQLSFAANSPHGTIVTLLIPKR
jgi:signal transduction histidine kinase